MFKTCRASRKSLILCLALALFFRARSTRKTRRTAKTSRSAKGVTVSQHRSISRRALGGGRRRSFAAVCLLLRRDWRRRLEDD